MWLQLVINFVSEYKLHLPLTKNYVPYSNMLFYFPFQFRETEVRPICSFELLLSIPFRELLAEHSFPLILVDDFQWVQNQIFCYRKLLAIIYVQLVLLLLVSKQKPCTLNNSCFSIVFYGFLFRGTSISKTLKIFQVVVRPTHIHKAYFYDYLIYAWFSMVYLSVLGMRRSQCLIYQNFEALLCMRVCC